MAAAAILIALAGLQLGKAFLTDGAEIAGSQAQPAPSPSRPTAAAAEQTEAPATLASRDAADSGPATAAEMDRPACRSSRDRGGAANMAGAD